MRLLSDDTTKTTTWGSFHDEGSHQTNTSLMNASAITLFVTTIFLICFYIWVKFWFRRQDRRIQRRITARIRSFFSTQSPLDPKFLPQIPTFVYSHRTRESPLEDCTICLLKFEEGDEGRVIPRCGHVFHVDCIDTWFRAKSSCPNCRGPVLPDDPVVPVNPPVTEAGINVENPREIAATRPDPVNA